MNLNIALLPGDGIGPEVIQQAVKVLTTIAEKNNHSPVVSQSKISSFFSPLKSSDDTIVGGRVKLSSILYFWRLL